MKRKMMVAGNWKMNLSPTESTALVADILNKTPSLPEEKEVVLCPPFLYTASAAEQTADNSNLHIGAQNCHQKASGAFTGEVAAEMLIAAGAKYVILGHSERRMHHQESDALLKEKLEHALEAGMHVIFCCGESLQERDANTQNEYISTQLNNSLLHLTADQLKKVVIAYEPIWAIGTGRTAHAQQAQDMHAHIRHLIRTQYDEQTAAQITILYGGSCKADNAVELFSCPDVDGGLIGGASLKAEDFLPIIEAMINVKK